MATYDVTDYGADPTDGSDDSAAIQAACDDASAGDTVFVPAVPDPGNDYYLLEPGGENAISLDESHNGITVTGEGYDSHLRFAGGYTSNYRGFRLDAGSGTLTDIRIESLRLDGNLANNSNASNGWGVLVFGSDASTPEDSGIELNGLWTHGWKTTGIQLSRGASANYCTSYENGTHGIVTAYGRNMASGEVNRIDHCHTHDNGYYGIDLHGKGTVTNHRGVNDGYGFKSSTDWDTRDAGAGHVHRVSHSRFEGFDYFGYQLTNPIQEIHLEDVEVADGGGWGFRFSKTCDVYIRGNGIKAVNIGRSRNEGGVRFGGDDVTAIDGSTTSTIRVDGTNGKDAVVAYDTSDGTVNALRYANLDGGSAYSNYASSSPGTSVGTTDAVSDVGSVSYPALSEVGAPAYSGGTDDGSTDDGSTTESEPEPSANAVALVTSGGYPVADGGYTLTQEVSSTTSSSTSDSGGGLATVTDFEAISNLSDTFDYGSRGTLSTAANYESGGSRSLAVGGSGGGYEEMVATPDAADPLPRFFAKGEVARFHLKASADAGYSGAIFGASDDANFYAVNITWDLDGVLVYRKSGGSFTTVAQESYLSGIGDTGKWYEVRVVRDDGTLGGSEDDITVEVRDPANDRAVLWSHTFNDGTHASNVGVGLQTNGFDASGEWTYLDHVVVE